nr:MAG TPA: hypothetical protein [Caudoviricetes sp.]
MLSPVARSAWIETISDLLRAKQVPGPPGVCFFYLKKFKKVLDI